MTCIINGAAHEIPFDPDTIELQQYIDFYNQYGRDIDKQLVSLEEGDEYGADGLLDKEAAAWFEFWTGYSLEGEHAEPLLLQYRMLRHMVNIPPDDYPLSVTWHGETWEIQAPVVNAASEMVFNEVITSKAAMQQIREAGAGKWDAMLTLAIFFFRRQGEPYTDKLMLDPERLALLKMLPLTYAAAVGFFLRDCVNIWSSTFPYFNELESGKPTAK